VLRGGSLGGRDLGLTGWRAAAKRSWALVLPVEGAAVFGVPFPYVAFTGRDPIGRLAAGDRTALAANKASIATSRPKGVRKNNMYKISRIRHAARRYSSNRRETREA